ncbi:MAG: hypothetical protein ACP5OG_01680 [Candidatus Nanoarchaeia archaeon]
MVSEKELGSIIITIIFIVAIAVIIARALFPFFIILSIVCLLGIIAMFFIDPDELGIILIISVISFVGLFLTYFIGYGIGGTSFGVACVQVYTSITGAEQQIQDSLYQAISDTVDNSCKTMTIQDCNTLKSSINGFKTVQDVTDMADNLRSVTKVAKKVDDTINK